MLMSAGEETGPCDYKLYLIAASKVFENTAANSRGELRHQLQVQGGAGGSSSFWQEHVWELFDCR